MTTRPLASLATQQAALLQALFAAPGGAAQAAAANLIRELADAQAPQTARGLAAYRSHAYASAERALLAAYPVIAALIGDANVAHLARELWHHHPPLRGDLAQWGDALPAFLDQHAQLADTPYLGDVARAEWALHRAGGAPDAPPDLPSFARLAQEDPQGLTLALAPGTALIASRYPVASLVTTHLHGHPGLDETGRRLRAGHAEQAVVWRQGLRPRIGPICPLAATLLTALPDGQDLPGALDAVSLAQAADDRFDFSAWLAQAVTDGLVLGIRDRPGRSAPRPTHQPLENPS
jgi:hypothetical protein